MPLVTLSTKGQIVLPQSIRDKLELKAGDNFAVAGKNNTIILKKIKIKDEFEDLYVPIKKIARKIEKELG